MRPLLLFLIAVPVIAAAAVPTRPVAPAEDDELAQARADAETAEAEREALERAVVKAGTEAERIRAQQMAAAQSIAAAEAQISVAEKHVQLTEKSLAALRSRLERQQRPVTALLSGLVVMGQRPPLLALADSDSLDELVRVQLLLDATVPAIRGRTAALRSELNRLRQVEIAAEGARAGLSQRRRQLIERQQRFAALEQQALRSQEMLQGEALQAADSALAADEDVVSLARSVERSRSAAALAVELAELGPAPLPRSGAESTPGPPFAYRLPSSAPVVSGMGAVSPNGIRSRGIRLATRRGSAVTAPADGIVRFAGPFRDYAGIVIMEHEDGWVSLIVNIASPLRPGARVRIGQALGRALSPIEVELSKDGRRVSPALIAGSSAILSNRIKGG